MSTSPSLREQWQAVAAQPLDYVQPASVGECFANALSGEQLQAMLAQPRFRPRLHTLFTEHFQLRSLTPPRVEADMRILLLAPEQLPRLALLCGATWHANALAREIRGAAVQTLKARLGHDVFDLALANRDKAGAADLLFDVEPLLAAIERDGNACVRAWLHSLPEDLRSWLRLRLDASWLHAADFSSQGIALIRHIAAQEFSP